MEAQLHPGSALPGPQRLALAYAPRHTRHITLAVLSLDARIAAILRGRGEPIAAQLRLAWWRDTLRQPTERWPVGEPALDALRGWRDASALAALPEGWEALLAEDLTPDIVAAFAAGRAGAFAGLARELGLPRAAEAASEAAEVWALADLAANVSRDAERRLVVEFGRARAPSRGLPRELRPLAVLAGLGERAMARGGAPLLSRPRDTLLALRIGLTGR